MSLIFRSKEVNMSNKTKEKYKNRITKIKIELFNDNFQNYKRYGIPKAQLVIADKRNREGIISPSLALKTPLECY